jgi:hypothetical protein
MLKTDIIFSDNKLSVQDWITTGLWGAGGVFWWRGVIAFVDSWRVSSHICPVLGWPEGWSVAMAIVSTGWNGAIGCIQGVIIMGAWNPSCCFCPVTSYGSPVKSRNMAQAGWLREKKSHCSHMAPLFPITGPALP